MKDVSVIVSECEGSRVHSRILNQSVVSVGRALLIGQDHAAKGRSVIVRPNYNETGPQGRFFREWRSVDGQPFVETRWDIS